MSRTHHLRHGHDGKAGLIMQEGTGSIALASTLTDTALIVRLGGEIDLLGAGPMGTALQLAAATLPPPDLIVLDLTAVAFFSAAGTHVLDAFAATCAARGLRARLVVETGSTVFRVIQMTDLGHRVAMFSALDQALPAHL